MSTIREQVMAEIEDVIRAAEDAGDDGIRAASEAFPGTPEMVIILASANVDLQRQEEWWQQVERTIDGEVIRKSIEQVGGGNVSSK